MIVHQEQHNCHLQIKALFKKPLEFFWIIQREEFTALEVAVHYNFVEIAKCLLFHLIRTKELNGNELNGLLEKAAEEGNTKIAHDLLIKGANEKYHGGNNNRVNKFYIFIGKCDLS
jgi:hypothetical protein